MPAYGGLPQSWNLDSQRIGKVWVFNLVITSKIHFYVVIDQNCRILLLILREYRIYSWGKVGESFCYKQVGTRDGIHEDNNPWFWPRPQKGLGISFKQPWLWGSRKHVFWTQVNSRSWKMMCNLVFLIATATCNLVTVDSVLCIWCQFVLKVW